MYSPVYFTLKELCYSKKAEERKVDNFPTFEVVEHLNELAEFLLDPIRKAWGGGVIVSSGFRCDTLNRIVGGSSTSAHPLGYAADLKPANGHLDEFISFVVKWLKDNNIDFDQVIDERCGGERWLHIGLYDRKGRQRRQVLNIKK